VPGYSVDLAGLLSGGAVLASAAATQNGRAKFDVSADAIRSAQDSLFTSGTLGRYCMMIESLAEAEKAS